MRRFYISLGAIGLLVFGCLFFFGPGLSAPPAQAANIHECSAGETARWFTDSAMFDVWHGGFPDWWRDEIIAAQGVWDAPSVGADFDFLGSSASVNEWTTLTDIWDNHAGISSLYYASDDNCYLTSVDTRFNTRWNFAICDSCDSGTYDVQTIAIHEFVHWLSLDHLSYWSFFDWDCVMHPEYSTDRTLCDDDIEGIIEIYGAD